MCKYNSKCNNGCKGKCRTKVQQVNKVVIFDNSNIPQGPQGDVFVPEETNSVFS